MSRLVERDREVAMLRLWCAEAMGGRGRIVFVSGEPGIGKSALVSVVIDEARQTGARTAIGRCDALSTPRALGPFTEVAAALGAQAQPLRDHMFTALATSARTGVGAVIVIEDAHWCDVGSIELLGMLGRRAADLPMLLVVTFRDQLVGVEHPLRLVLGDLVASGSTSLITLHPLSHAGVDELAATWGVRADEALHRSSGGNPFFVTELLRASDGEIPITVRHAVMARAARLTPAARAVLDAVAIVPGRCERWLLDGVVPHADRGVAACVADGMLVADAEHVSFRHELARLAVEGELPDDVRRVLHGSVAATLAGRSAEAARIAHHACAAGNDRLAAQVSVIAASDANARGGYTEAISHGRRALALHAHLDPDTLASVREVVAGAMAATSENDDALVLANAAAVHWGSTGNAQRQAAALVTLAGAASGSGRAAVALQAGHDAVQALEHEPPSPELAAAFGVLTALYMLDRDRDNAVVWGDRAVALARSLDDHESLGRAMIQRGIAEVMEGDLEAVEQIREGMGIGLHHGLPPVVSLGYMQLGSGFGELRRYDDAVPALVDGIAWSSQHGLEAHRRYELAWVARCRFDLGEWDAADASARAALAGPRSAGTTLFVALNTLGWLRARRGDDDVWPALDEALAIARRTGHLQRLWPVAVARAEAGWLTGDLESHVPLLEEAGALAVRHHDPMAIGEIGVWLRRCGRAGAVQAGEAAEPFASWLRGDLSAATAGFMRLGCPYEAALALVESDTTSSLRQALATFERLGARPMRSHVAERLRARGANVVQSHDTPGSGVLSAREHEVLRLVGAGFTNPQIAATLYISRKTAEHHVSNILTKLGVASRTEAATVGARLGLLES